MTEPAHRDPAPEDTAPAGCGVQGCLFAAVALFVILLVGILVVAVIRFSSPPQPRFGMSASAPIPAAAVLPRPSPDLRWWQHTVSASDPQTPRLAPMPAAKTRSRG